MQKILITGGLGFIGTHLANQLMATQDYRITIVDNLSNNWSEVDEFVHNQRVSVHVSSVQDFEFKEKYDQIYHLASPVGPAGVLNYAGIMGKMIIDDALKIAEYSHKHGARVLYISTSEVYGSDPGNHTQKEDIEKIVPPRITIRLEYGVAKLLMEICVSNYAKYYPFGFNFIRPFNIIGIGQSAKAGFVVPRFVWQALHNENITVFGDGNQVRTFTHVKDIVDGLIAVMDSGIVADVFNVGNPDNKLSILGVAKKIKSMTGSKSKIAFVDPKSIYGDYYEEAWNKIPDITKISSMTGWQPKFSFDETVHEIINHYQKAIDKGTRGIAWE